ncbi:MAG TPA: iron ABC transporter permease [Sphaerochaeta sp.]|nr:iron ABC transporter permease [Sphaerochaeta sp.]
MSEYEKQKRQKMITLTVLLALSVLFGILSLFLGRYPKAGFTSPVLFYTDSVARTILTKIRLPRVVLALASGAMLGASGFTFQLLFSNPLVEPGFLGVSQGAAFGAALMIIFAGASSLSIQLSAMIFGLLGLVFSYYLSTRFRFGGPLLRLVLAGIAVSAFFSSGLGVIKLVAEPTKDLQDITFWMMGGLWNASWGSIIPTLVVIAIALTILHMNRFTLNLLSINEKTSFSLGLNPKRQRVILLVVATVGTTFTISVTGLIGWVGLITPHIARKTFGSEATHALPASMVMGAFFLLLCDSIGRTILPTEIPIGLLTSLFGALIFVLILSGKSQEGKA